MIKKTNLVAVVFLLSLFSCSEKQNNSEVLVVETFEVPPTNSKNVNYIGNKAPLVQSALIKLPLGSIKPDNWLKESLQRQADGLMGNLGEISAWLQKEDNAWLAKDGKGSWGWEEVP